MSEKSNKSVQAIIVTMLFILAVHSAVNEGVVKPTKKWLTTPAVFVVEASQVVPSVAPQLPTSTPSATPTPTPAPKPTTVSQKPSSIEDLIRQEFGKDARVALAVAKCESGLRHKAMNDNTTWGGVGRDWSIFQINDYYHKDKADIKNLTAEENIKLAKRIFDGSGWRAWSCYKNGKYLKHLK